MITKLKRLLSKGIICLIRILHKFDEFLNKNIERIKPYNFEDLTPKDDVDKDKKYSEAIDWALKNNNIKNIALTGSYGSGKSSILRTYERKHKEYRYLNISLASFKDDSQNENDNLIERNILQQMFYRVKHETIPYSRFKRIKNLKNVSSVIKIISVIFLMIIWIISGLLLFKPTLINNLNQNITNLEKFNIWGFNHSIFIFIIFVVFFSGIIIIILDIFRGFNNLKLNKINLNNGNGNIELGEDSEVSIFNKYLDEILYFFEVKKYDVVVIEDLDRFDSIDIFTKLRELNSLINNSEQINRRIVFIYAIRDNMFLDEERTKFFDFMIPVIPVINSSNSEGILLKKINKSNLNEQLSERFISDITLYIDNMRMLINIYNEFIIYKEKLESDKLDLEKLFSIVVYKNIYPTDFTNLQFNKGMVYNVFQNKAKLIKDRIKKIEDEIIKIREEIDILENEYLNNIKELRAVYLELLMQKLPNKAQGIQINNSKCLWSEMKQDKNFQKLRFQNNIRYYYNGRYVNGRNISFDDLEVEIGNNLTYDEREKIIKRKKNNEVKELKKQLDQLSKEKNTIRSLSLKRIINKINENEVFNEEISREKLLVFLIRNGYINEMYHSFISYFYSGSITKEDRDFVLSVKNQNALNVDHKLNKPKKVMKKLYIDEFKREEVLNYDLVDFIIKDIKVNNYRAYYNLIISQLSNESEKSIEFIDGYREVVKDKEYFIKSLCKEWDEMWKFIELESDFPVEKKDECLLDIIKFANIKDISKMNRELILTEYISKKEDFLKLVTDNEDIEKVKEIIRILDVKFSYLDNHSDQKELFRFVYKNNFYEINQRMIEVIIKIIDEEGVNKIEDLKTANYTTIKESSCESLINYVDENINEYIENVFLRLENNNYESEEIVINLLNREEIKQKNKEAIIDKQDTLITYIIEVNSKELWSKLIQDSKIKIEWFNLINYYIRFKDINRIIVDFLNKEINYKKLAKIKLNEDEGFQKEVISQFSNDLIKNEGITRQSFKYIRKNIPYVYKSIDVKGLSDNRVEDMINYNLLSLTNENINSLKENFDNKHITLIEENIESYLEERNEYELDSKDMKQLLNSIKISEEQKIIIIKNMNENLIKEDFELIDLIYNIISEEQSKGQLNYKDMRELLDLKIINNIDENIINKKNIKLINVIYSIFLQDKADKELNVPLLYKLIDYGQSINSKIKLFNTQIKYLSKKDITVLLKKFDDPYPKLTTTKRPLIENNEINKELLEELDAVDYISSVKERDDGLMRAYTKKKK